MGLFGTQPKQEPVSAPLFEEEPFDELPPLPKANSTTIIAKGITFTGVIRGEGNVQIEGRLEPGQKVVVVEDLISTAGSVLEVVGVLREAGAEVLGIASIFTYGMKKGLQRLAEAHVRNISLTDFDTIARAAAEERYIKSEDIARLIAFRDNPSDESWIGRKG